MDNIPLLLLVPISSAIFSFYCHLIVLGFTAYPWIFHQIYSVDNCPGTPRPKMIAVVHLEAECHFHTYDRSHIQIHISYKHGVQKSMSTLNQWAWKTLVTSQKNCHQFFFSDKSLVSMIKELYLYYHHYNYTTVTL